MNKFLYIVCVMLLLPFSVSGQTTDDHVTIGEATLFPGGDVCSISVSLPNATQYTAVGLDIYIPEGCEFVKQECLDADEEVVMAYAGRGTACRASHIVDSEIQSDGALRVAVYSQQAFKSSGNLFSFFVKASTYVKPGYIPVEIKKCSFTGTNVVKYKANDITVSDKVSVSASAKASFNISAENKWSTLVLPFDVPSLPSEVMAFTCNESDDDASVLILNRVSSLSAYKPYILRSENGCTVNLSGTVDANNYPATGVVAEGYLKGAVTQQVATSGEYVLANKDGKTQFYKVANSKTIPAGKCWMALPSGMSAKENFGFQISTGIKNVVSGKGVGAKYSLDGRKINVVHPQQLYIEGGKKKIGR